jgi:hypothetical protein
VGRQRGVGVGREVPLADALPDDPLDGALEGVAELDELSRLGRPVAGDPPQVLLDEDERQRIQPVVGRDQRGQQGGELVRSAPLAIRNLLGNMRVDSDRFQDHVAEQLFLVAEVVVERRAVHPQLARDVVHPHCLEALLLEDLGCGSEQGLLARGIASAGLQAGSFAPPPDRALFHTVFRSRHEAHNNHRAAVSAHYLA